MHKAGNRLLRHPRARDGIFRQEFRLRVAHGNGIRLSIPRDPPSVRRAGGNGMRGGFALAAAAQAAPHQGKRRAGG